MRRRPNGGHGGAGGNVVIQADERMQNLATATHHFKGGAGLNGMRASVISLLAKVTPRHSHIMHDAML
jgi:GTPase involved in cell partitioning and DNA repair